jgi:hypothetical protein
LRNVSVIRWESNRVVLKHAGGADPIAFSLIAEPLRSQLNSIREASMIAAAEGATKGIADQKQRTVQGQVFVTTRGAGSYKFSGAPVQVFNMSDWAAAKDKQSGNLSAGWKLHAPDTQAIEIGNAWADALEKFAAVASTTTDADGNFSLKVPSGDYFVVCLEGRLVGSYREQNIWVVQMPTNAERLDLNSNNLWEQPQ